MPRYKDLSSSSAGQTLHDVTGSDPSKRMQVFLKGQDVVLNEFCATVERWSDRRHEGVQATLDAATQMLLSKYPPEVAMAWTRWFSAAMARLADDVEDQMTVARSAMDGFADDEPTEIHVERTR